MEPKKQGLKRKISYEVMVDPRTCLKITKISTNNMWNLTTPCTIFKNEYDHYIVLSHFNVIEDSNTLHILCYDEEHKSFLTEGSSRNKIIQDYCHDGNHKRWWMNIMKDFNNVFGSITHGLGAIHRTKAFQENMLNGAAIKNTWDGTSIGILFNMAGDPRQEVSKEDISRLP